MANCDYCGKYGEERAVSGPMSGSRPPQGWIQKRKSLISVLWFCSKKCQNEYNGGQSTNDDLENSSSEKYKMIAEEKLAKARLEWEEEQAFKKEQAEKKAKREAKAAALKEQGKPFMSWVTLNQTWILVGFLLFLWIPILDIFQSAIISVLSIILLLAVLIWGGKKYYKEYKK